MPPAPAVPIEPLFATTCRKHFAQLGAYEVRDATFC
jgi:hypothetical protein